MPLPPKDKEKPQKAVALTYEHLKDPAPMIVAKGEGFMAEQIIKVAEEHGIHIHKDADLVEILSVLELETFIPLEAYTAVAEILSYLYKRNGEGR